MQPVRLLSTRASRAPLPGMAYKFHFYRFRREQKFPGFFSLSDEALPLSLSVCVIVLPVKSQHPLAVWLAFYWFLVCLMVKTTHHRVAVRPCFSHLSRVDSRRALRERFPSFASAATRSLPRLRLTADSTGSTRRSSCCSRSPLENSTTTVIRCIGCLAKVSLASRRLLLSVSLCSFVVLSVCVCA